MDNIRVAIVGTGGRGCNFVGDIKNRRADTDIIALCDRIRAKAEWAIREYGLCDAKAFDSIEKMLSSIDCDAVIIATADAHHAEAAVPALEAGKYVFLEKPLDTTLAGCRAIIEADEKAGGKTFVGFNLRYAPVYETLKAQVDAGAIGKVLTIQADEFYNGGRTYFRRWNRLRSEGGGLWITKASHDFDLLAWFAGTRPRQIYAAAEKTYYVPKAEAAMQCRHCKLQEACPDRALKEAPAFDRLTEEHDGPPYDLCLYNADSDTFDHGIATVHFEDGIIATYTCNVVVGFEDRRMRVSGTKGTMDGHLAGEMVILRRRDPSETIEVPLCSDVSDGHGGADGRMLDQFLRFVRGIALPKCRPAEAAIAICMGLAATRSSDEHRAINMDEFRI